MADWKAPAPDAKDPAGEREEARLYADLSETMRAWAHSYPCREEPREAGAEGDREAGQ